jgi:two-component system NtrC family sensor kinase
VQERVTALSRVGDNERLLSVGKLASGIAHELGTPLNVITGRAQIILADEAKDSENAKNARIIVEQTKRITKIIRSLQEFANPRPLQKSSVDLRMATSQALLTLSPLAERAQAALDVEEGEPLRAPVDVGQLQKALINLVTNALHASRGGRVNVKFRTDTVQPPVLRDGTLGPRVPYAIIDVHDTGHGMNAETVGRVFEPFFTTRDVGEGTGLGLSLTHGIVREHGGFIHVTSEVGVGTTFSIHLPLLA